MNITKEQIVVRFSGTVLLAALGLFVSGCAHWPATPRLEQAGAPGYRVDEAIRSGQSDDLW